MHTDDERTADMANPAAKYTDEFRRETADYIISTGGPITECCTELGLNLNLNPPPFLIHLRKNPRTSPFPVVAEWVA